MAAPCGPCLPWFVPGGGPGFRALGASGAANNERREAWLEEEVTRLSRRFQELAETSECLKKQLTAQNEEPQEEVVCQTEIVTQIESQTASSERPSLGRRPTVSVLDPTEGVLVADPSSEDIQVERDSITRAVSGWMSSLTLKGSASSMKKPWQASIYTLAFAGVLFVLLAAGLGLGGHIGDDVEATEAATGVVHGDVEGSVHMGWSDVANLDEHLSSEGLHSGIDGQHSAHGHDSSAGADHGSLDEHNGTADGNHSSADGHHASAGGNHGSADGGHSSAGGGHGSADGGYGGVDMEPGSAGHRRRLFGAAPKLLRNIAFALTGVGLMSLIMNFLQQPLILGYLLGGVLVGPEVLQIVNSHHDISELSELGLIFLLFLIGMELDIKELLKMGKVVLLTGFLQFPVCAGSMFLVFMALDAAGLSFGSGPYATLYCGLTCGISSTMIVAKVLGEKGEMGSPPGRLTIGILIFQDIWAIVVLAIQPNLANPEILGILGTFAMIAVLIGIALAYAKFVMPAVLFYASRSTELMLVLSLAWCFFICCTAILPFIGLSMELAALIAGVALATFPYSAEFNGKIKYIRDFFITLFFAGLGMQIPAPTFGAIFKGLVVAAIVLAFRWLGIFVVVCLLGGSKRLAAVSTINLSEISEFALVICSIGMTFGHVESETMTIIIWTFAILAVAASYLIGYNKQIFLALSRVCSRILCRKEDGEQDESDGQEHDHEERDIVLLGFHRIASMLIAEFQARNPEILKRIHIIDVNQHIMPQLRQKGVKCTYGDFAAPDVLEHAHHGEARMVICTIPDSLLKGTTNLQLLKVTREVWPDANCIVTADSPYQAHKLYQAGADYVLRMAKLCAERLQKMLSEHFTQASNSGELSEIFALYRKRDKDFKSGSQFLSVKV